MSRAGGAEPSNKLWLRSATVDTSQATNLLAPGQRGALDATRWHVLQLDGPMTPQRRAELERAGVELGDYLPDHAYLVRLGGADPAALAATAGVQWLGVYEDAWKIDPAIGRPDVPYATPRRQAIAAAGEVMVTITLFRDADATSAEQALAAAGARIVEKGEVAGQVALDAVLSPAQLPALAAVSAVQYIEDAAEITYRNSTTRWIVQSNTLNLTPLYDNGLTGLGQVVGILDGEVNVSHCAFRDTVNPIGPNHRKILAYNTTQGYNSHGTHVAGTAVGDAGSFDNNRGIAYEGKLVYNEESLTGSTAQTRWTQHHTQGARVHTNSWGNDGTTSYDALARAADDFSRQNEDSLVLFAVTNLSSLKNPENAKNVLAVGASQDTPSQGSHCSGGTGPTSDGRRKPEIYAPGCSTNSSTGNGTSCSTTTLTGTSMASPAVAGTAMLVRQYFTDGYYPSGAPEPGDGFTPTAALVKATLLNSAVDMTGITGYPSNSEGWGRVLADDALYFPNDARKLWVEDVRNADGLSTADVVEYLVFVESPSQKLKVTLVWTDVPATSGASQAAINDLDLEVVSPSMELYRGNVFNTATGLSTTGGTKDSKNNVEQVHVNNPVQGVWTVRVNAAAVNQSTQGYALVVTGDITPTQPPLRVNLVTPPPAYTAPGSGASFTMDIRDGAELLVPGSTLLHYRADGGDFVTVPLIPLGGDLYEAPVPVVNCGDEPEFYVSATGEQGTTVTYPPDAPASLLSLDVGTFATIVSDNFETDSGWTTSFSGATAGYWQRGVPVNNPNWLYAPAADGDGSGQAWLTENDDNPNYIQPFNTDVDNGSVTLTSPAFELDSPLVQISYLYYLRLTGASGDRLLVEINTNDGVGAWIPIGNHVTDGGRNWRSHTITPAELIVAGVTPSATTRLRFTANDADPQAVVEAGLDGLVIEAFVCVPPDSCTDGLLNQGEERIDCGGPCPACACTADEGCDDGAFCTGSETCDDFGACLAGADPCDGLHCDEDADACVDCLRDEHCDDGVFCNGAEVCSNSICLEGTPPCEAGLCMETEQLCLTTPPCVAADVNCDGTVDAGDLLSVRAPGTWATTGTPGWVRADVNNDGAVDAGDLLSIRAPGTWQTATAPCNCP
jgi:subtilisin family serine protease